MTVTVFSSSQCAICHSEMKWLDQNNVSYQNVVIDEEDDGIEKLMQATGGAMTGTPFTVVDNDGATETVSGFDRKKLASLIGIN